MHLLSCDNASETGKVYRQTANMARVSGSSSSRSTSAQHLNGPDHTTNRHQGPNSTKEDTKPKHEEDDEHDDDEVQSTTNSSHDYASIQSPFTSAPLPYDTTLLPGGKRSLSSIGLQSFWLGFTLAASLVLGAQMAYHGHALWRLFAFGASLSTFHFLEYWTTATYNLPAARATSFLLFTNGTAYNVAHSCAVLEILLSIFVFPRWGARYTNFLTVSLGLFLVLFGQATRSIAMATAGTNFNHTPQKVKKEGHELVTNGVYAYSRHPSYFAFFWWAIGTQILVGNKVCLLAFIAVLWNFFNSRIKGKFPIHKK